MTILDQIVETKKHEVARLKQERPDLECVPSNPRSYRFLEAIRRPQFSVIAEVKKASPSRGVIRHDFDPVALAQQFNQSGAAALSVLTDGPYFQGSPLFVPQIKDRVPLPILRKEFIIDPIQIAETVELGADAILLIKAILTNDQCHTLLDAAHHAGLDVVIEVHDANELADILPLQSIDMIGINNRNLNTFDTDISLSPQLKAVIDRHDGAIPVIAESGYSTIDQLRGLARDGFAAVLIGEGLATNPDLMGELAVV